MKPGALAAPHDPRRHPLDPPRMHDAAERLGRLVADGLLTPEDAHDAIKLYAADAKGVATGGLQTRLSWSMRDAAIARLLARDRGIRAALREARPLIESRAEPDAIMQAALHGASHAIATGAVSRDDLRQELRQEWSNIHSGQMRRRRR